MGLNQDYSGASSAYMRNDQEIGLKWHASLKCHLESPNNIRCGVLAPACMNHKVFNGKPVAKMWGTKVLRIMHK
jgi:hypothetical protein